MLVQLDIENIAVIERASIEFNNGVNVITGETGAGKSLLINSLNMALGCRASKDLIREGADAAKVSAIFFCPEITSLLEENDIEPDDGNIVLSRKLYRDGRNVCHINGSAVNVSLLRTVGEKLVVIHGQHDSSALLDTTTHIHFLDSFAKNTDLLNSYRETYRELRSSLSTLEKYNSDEVSRRNETDYLTYQAEEIEKAALSPEEEDELTAKKNVLENSEALSKYARNAVSLLSGDSGIKDMLYDLKRNLEKLSDIDSSTSPHFQKAEELYYEAEELARDISDYSFGIEYNPSELERINDRLNTINSLKRKYNMDVPAILDFYDSISEKLTFLNSFNENKEALEKNVEALRKKAQELAEKLTLSRKESAAFLSERLTLELASLDMSGCVIDFSFTPSPLYEYGGEHVELLISTNPAEPPKSLAKIASGGEISRVMLAIKSVFSDFDRIPTLLFDEIDTGVSGRAAEKISLKMRALSEKYQLICVTHLPVIAACADHHLLLEKVLIGNGYSTQIRTLSKEERVHEIARIISGDNVNSISLENAKQMLKGG